MKTYLVCDVLRDRELGHLLGFNPARAFRTEEAAQRWAEQDTIKRDHPYHECVFEWRTVTEDGETFLVCYHSGISRQLGQLSPTESCAIITIEMEA